MQDKVKLSNHQSQCALCNKIFSGPIQEKDHLLSKPHLKRLKTYEADLLSQEAKNKSLPILSSIEVRIHYPIIFEFYKTSNKL
jgi:hypothetical protein